MFPKILPPKRSSSPLRHPPSERLPEQDDGHEGEVGADAEGAQRDQDPARSVLRRVALEGGPAVAGLVLRRKRDIAFFFWETVALHQYYASNYQVVLSRTPGPDSRSRSHCDGHPPSREELELLLLVSLLPPRPLRGPPCSPAISAEKKVVNNAVKRRRGGGELLQWRVAERGKLMPWVFSYFGHAFSWTGKKG